MEWESLAHRVSHVEAGLGPGGVVMGMSGGVQSGSGPSSDGVHYRLASVEVRNARARVGYGRAPVTIERRGLNDDGDFEHEGVGTATLQIPLGEVGSWPVYTAVIQGFGLSTDVEQGADFPADYDASLGYTLGLLSIEAGPAERADEFVAVDVSLRFEPASSGESTPDRLAMNSSIPLARFEGWVDVALIGHERSGTTLPLSARGQHPYSPPYSPQEPTVVDVEFDRGRLAGWRSLSFEANPGGSGDYIRSVGAEILGAEELQAVGFELTSSSHVELAPFFYSISGTMALLSAGDEATVLLRSREGETDAGTWTP